MPFPQVAATQGLPGVGHLNPTSSPHVALQPSPFTTLPSSHCSPDSSIPLPHTAGTTTIAHMGTIGIAGASLKTLQPGLHGSVVHIAELDSESVESDPVSPPGEMSVGGVYACVAIVPPSAPQGPHVPFVHVALAIVAGSEDAA